jgi:hypothetical protein
MNTSVPNSSIEILPQPIIPAKVEVPIVLNDIKTELQIPLIIISSILGLSMIFILIVSLIQKSNIFINNIGGFIVLFFALVCPLLIAYLLEVSMYDPEDEKSIKTLYEFRLFQKCFYSFITLIFLLYMLKVIYDNNKNVLGDISVISYLYSWILLIISTIGFTYLFYSCFNESLEYHSIGSSSASYFSIAFLLLIYMLFTGTLFLYDNTLVLVIAFVVSVILFGFAVSEGVSNYEIKENRFDLESTSNNSLPTTHYNCKGVYTSDEIIKWVEDEGGEIKINFDVNLSYLGSDKTLIQCGPDDNLSWKIIYIRNTNTIQLNYRNLENISINITNDMVETDSANEDGDVKYMNITMIARTYKNIDDLDVFTGNLIFYHDNKKYDQNNIQSIFSENIIPPSQWDENLTIYNYDTIKNFLYCSERKNMIKNMSNGVKFVLVSFYSLIILLIVLSIIHPKVRLGLFGSKMSSFSLPGLYSKIMQ